MDESQKIEPHQIVSMRWQKKTLIYFRMALIHYQSLIAPYAKKGNEKINNEIAKIDLMLSHLKLKYSENDVGYTLIGENWEGETIGWMSDVMHKYWAMKSSQIKDAKSGAHISGALEAEETELNELTEIMQNKIWERVERVKVLVDDFFPTHAKANVKINLDHNHALYVHKKNLDNLVNIKRYNTKKLIQLCNELNFNFNLKNYYSCAALIRAIIDHIPPLLNCINFSIVVNNYPWSKTDKKYMDVLLKFKIIADDSLHRQITKTEDLIQENDIPSPILINRLLQECIEKNI